MKLAWAIICREDRLWVRVLTAKYFQIVEGRVVLRDKTVGSPTWRAIKSIWPVVQQGVRWVIGDGRRVSFWYDWWVEGCDGCLINHVTSPVGGEQLQWPIARFVTESGAWNWSLFQDLLPQEILLMVAAMLPPVNGQLDFVCWGCSDSGSFTTKSAYGLLANSGWNSADKLWSWIWKWNGPQRVRSFLWLVVHERLMTNDQRFRRKFSSSPCCPACNGVAENTLHVLRGCWRARRVWRKLVNPELWEDFVSSSLHEWIRKNFACDYGIPGVGSWSTTFGVTLWKIWEWRNGWVFGRHGVGFFSIPAIRNLVSDILSSLHSKALLVNKPVRVWRDVGWVAPPTGWYKLNTDGSSRGNPGMAGAGGVCRDAAGGWCFGFSVPLGVCTSFRAEAWAVFFGLSHAWAVGLTQVVLEVDSQALVTLLGSASSGTTSSLLLRIHGLLNRNWQVQISHVYREANRIADSLATHTTGMVMQKMVFMSPPSFCIDAYKHDLWGVSWPRACISR